MHFWRNVGIHDSKDRINSWCCIVIGCCRHIQIADVVNLTKPKAQLKTLRRFHFSVFDMYDACFKFCDAVHWIWYCIHVLYSFETHKVRFESASNGKSLFLYTLHFLKLGNLFKYLTSNCCGIVWSLQINTRLLLFPMLYVTTGSLLH